MNENQKKYVMSKMYEIQLLLEEQELEKKELNAGFNEVIKRYKKKITRFIHAIKDENVDYLNDMMESEELKKFEKIV